MINIDVELEDSFYKKINHENVEKAIEKGLDHGIHDAENTCKREAPIDTGNLRRSIHKNKPGKGVRELIAPDAPYWVYVNYGTSKMLADPFVTITAEEVGPKIPRYIRDELKHMGDL